ncbi:TCP-1/cpn60 chaperonin family protein [Halobellus clavatus]|jgi:chaperonin GroEL (HSP60 family)|uniref:Chaperonin GroEL (HSP60 family) n=1 Tax=Halobellus clavatus TaxID=660517 RepID=A0A1H3HIJ8_9EURY|nr:TCP-1/cpn60 chaperonin family protein [Halobellus clavatus]SDY15180.1 Chaperonin GroEL (HSP60 family) [Halobellus clavatus]
MESNPTVQSGGRPDDAEHSITFPHANITAIDAISGVFRSTVGPQSMDVLLLDTPSTGTGGDTELEVDDYAVTGDGAHLLQSLSIQHPVGELLERSIGPYRPGDTDIDGKDIFDGVSSKVLFANALLTNSIDLLEQGVHPQEIVSGFKSSLKVAEDTLRSSCITPEGNQGGTAADAARTALTGNDFGKMRDEIADLAAAAAEEIGEPNERTFDVTTVRHGSIRDSRLIEGTVLDRNTVVRQDMPRRVDDASVLLLGGHDQGGLQDPDIVDDFEVELESPETIGTFERMAANQRRDLVDQIVQAGTDVVVTQMGINSHYQQLLADHGIMAIRRVHPRNLQRLSLSTGANVVKANHDVDSKHLGRCDTVVEREIEQRKHRRKHRRIVIFEGCTDPDSVTMLLCGTFGPLESQVPRQVRKAVLAAAQSTRDGPSEGVVPGGGATEMAIARRIKREAKTHDSKSQLAMNEYASALESLVESLVANAGMDPLATVADLRRANRTDSNVGVVLPEGDITDTLEAGVVDTIPTKKNVYRSGTDLAALVLRVDDAIDATFEGNTVDTGDAIYQEPAEQHQEHVEETGSPTVWE